MLLRTGKDNRKLVNLGVFLITATILIFGGMIVGGLNRFLGGNLSLRAAHQILLITGGLFFIASFIASLLQYKNFPILTWLMASGFVVIAGQAILGQLLLKNNAIKWSVGLHYGLSVLILASVTAATVYYFGVFRFPSTSKKLRFDSRFSQQAVAAVGMVLLVLTTGVFVSVSGARDVCQGWPLCEGALLPQAGLAWVAFLHRLFVSGVGIYLVYFNLKAWEVHRSSRLILTTANMLVVLYFAQAFVGAVLSLNDFPVHLLILHEATAAWLVSVGVILLVVLGITARPNETKFDASRRKVNHRQRLKDFLALNKPVVVLLLLSTTLAGMVIGAKGFPAPGVVVVTLISGALAAGGSSAINQYIDRDLDGLMTRTSRRPIPAGRLTPAEGLAFGVTALLVSFYLLAGFVNILAALLALVGMIYYIVIYSILLKKRSVQNIVIGGGAGAIPPLVGWAAATGGLDLTSIFLFLIIFFWTPPHFWALALLRKQEYKTAGVPMMPVERGETATKKLIFQYSVVLVVVTLLLGILGLAGWIYLIGAIFLGAYLLYLAREVVSNGRNRAYYRMYRHSNYYLFFLFLILAIDAVII